MDKKLGAIRPLDRHLPLESHLDRRINTGVIWAVRSHCMKEGRYHKKISDISPIFCHRRRFFEKISDISPRTDISPIYLRYIIDFLPPEAIFWKNLRYISPNRYIADILAIFTEISHLQFFSMKYRVDPSRYTIYRRYIPIFSSMHVMMWEMSISLQIFLGYLWLRWGLRHVFVSLQGLVQIINFLPKIFSYLTMVLPFQLNRINFIYIFIFLTCP